MLEIGYNDCFEIRAEKIPYQGKQPLRVVYASDFHFNRFSGKIVARLVSEIERLAPDVLLLGGDYVDSKKGLFHLNAFLGKITGSFPVMAIAGNHDHFFGIEKIKQIMEQQQIHWIEKSPAIIRLKDNLVRIDSRYTIALEVYSDLRILCLHKPLDINSFAGNYTLAFAGHLHGSQFVFWKQEHKLFPGKFIYKWNILKTSIGNCHYYISKGLGDTLPIRYNCPKDILVVDLEPER